MDANEKALLRNTLVTLAGVCALLSLASCDSFLVPKCDFYADQQECSNPPEKDGSANPVGQPDQPPPPGMQISEPSFAWAAKIPLTNLIKYVGISQGKAITWNNNSGSYLSSHILKLLEIDKNQRIVSQGCASCPNVSTLHMNYYDEQIYVAGENYWRLKYHDDYAIINLVTGMAISSITTDSQSPRVFFHPLKNLLSMGAKTGSPSVSGVSVIWNGSAAQFLKSGVNIPTAFALGDLDAVDHSNPLDEIVLFSGPLPIQLARPTIDASYVYDEKLLSGLTKVILNKKSDDTPIGAAFIADLNNDGRIEFVYSKNGIVFVVTYLGNYKFQNWQETIPLNITGETIRSLSAIDLTKDNLPELVVETDMAVHFYVNQPK